jgi:chemotaxis protein MotB
MKTKLKVVLATAGIAAVLLTGCVSSKKYNSSQAALQQVRNDSANLAQQVSSLNGNVNSLQQKNATLQRSLDSTSSNYATQQKTLNYYQEYFTQQQSTMSQVSDQLKGALSQAGLANEDVQQVNNVIYVRLNEDQVFKKNSTVVTTSGKQALNGLAEVIKSRSDVNVFVSNGDSSTMQSSAATSMASTDMNNMPANAAPKHRSSHRGMASRKSTAKGAAPAQSDAASSSGGGAASGATAQNSGKSKPAAAHKKVHRNYSSEGSMTYYSNGPKASKSKAWALKQGRMNTVANNFLQSGIPKVNLSMEQPALNGNQQNSSIKVIITPTMNDFNPQNTPSPGTGSK